MSKGRIKKVFRMSMPETNSSSSHSVVISTNRNLIDKNGSNFDIPWKPGNILFVPCRDEDFGWESDSFNNPLDKLQYVCGIIFKYREDNSKLITLLTESLKEFTGADDVMYEWVEKAREHMNDEEYGEDDFFNYYPDAPDIDHNSSDIFSEIIESKRSIIDFIFNDKSWLFLGSDGFCEDLGNIVSEEDKTFGIVSINFGGMIGRLDVEMNYSIDPDNLSSLRDILREDKVLSSIKYSKDTNEFKIVVKNPTLALAVFPNPDNSLMYFQGDVVLDSTSNKLYLVFATDEIFYSYLKRIRSKLREDKFQQPSIGGSEIIVSSDSRKYLDEMLGKDEYVTVPIESITINEFGKIYG